MQQTTKRLSQVNKDEPETRFQGFSEGWRQALFLDIRVEYQIVLWTKCFSEHNRAV